MRRSFSLAAFCVSSLICCANGSTLHVDANGNNPVPPYSDWSTAATTIQDAIDVSSTGDLILVTNGVYQFGGRPLNGETLTNRVAIDKAVTVQSANGPAATTIEGYQDPATTNADDAVRGAYLADGAALVGFTIEHGATLYKPNTQTNAEANGGGIWCQSSNAIVSNCVIVSNACSVYGAGVYSGTLTGCQVNYNSIQGFGSFGAGAVAYSSVADSTINSNYFFQNGGEAAGAGAFSCVLSNCIVDGNLKSGVMACSLDHCTIADNTNSLSGAGAANSTLNNCFIYGNQTPGWGGGASGCVLNNCIVSNNWAGNRGGGVVEGNGPIGTNNVVVGNSTAGFAGGLYIGGTSNVVVDGWHLVNNSASRDGGGLYFNPPSTYIAITVTNCTFDENFSGGNGGGFCPYYKFVAGGISHCTFSGNVAAGDAGGAYYGALDNCVVIGNQAANGGGVYGLVTNCVLEGNSAATNGGGLYYAPGGAAAIMPNCEFTNNYAVNGGGSYGGIFTNCVFAANSATNGGGVNIGAFSHCLVISNQADFGGGLFEGGDSVPQCPGTQANYLESEFIGNSALIDGGGIYSSATTSGTNCLFQGNSASDNGGGTYNAILSKCTIASNTASNNGGGAYVGRIQLCIFSNNVAMTNGGGTYNASLMNCLEIGNSAAYGGASALGSLNNSTIVGNSATVAGGGTYFPGGASVVSCVIYDNTAPTGPNYSGYAGFSYCCLTPLPPASSSNITNDPTFVNLAANNFRLQSNSPCINIGSGPVAMTDLDGRPRVVGGRADIGAYEYQGPSVGEFTAWLQQYELPTDGTADYKDSDGDGMNNWQEWIAGTDPINPTSVLKLMIPKFTMEASEPVNITLTWQSVTDRTYFIQRSADLGDQPFSTLASNILGQAGTTSFTDTNAVRTDPFFYRVGIE